MDTLCSILFSRRTQGVLFGLILAAAILRNRTMWIITAAIVGTACAGMAIVAVAGLRRCGTAGRGAISRIRPNTTPTPGTGKTN